MIVILSDAWSRANPRLEVPDIKIRHINALLERLPELTREVAVAEIDKILVELP